MWLLDLISRLVQNGNHLFLLASLQCIFPESKFVQKLIVVQNLQFLNMTSSQQQMLWIAYVEQRFVVVA